MDRQLKEETYRLVEEFHIQWNFCLYHLDTIDMLGT